MQPNCPFSLVSSSQEVEGAPVVIVGLEAAYQLWRRKVRCVLIEAGPVGELRHINYSRTPSEAMRIWLDAEKSDPVFRARWHSASPPYFSDYSGLRQVVGGRSLYWHGIVLPIENWALDESWPGEVRMDLISGRHGIPPLYDQVLADLQPWTGLQHEPNAAVRLLNALGYSAAVTAPSAKRPKEMGGWESYSALRSFAECADNLEGRDQFSPLLWADAWVSRSMSIQRRVGASSLRSR
jgi:hypothetical protein